MRQQGTLLRAPAGAVRPEKQLTLTPLDSQLPFSCGQTIAQLELSLNTLGRGFEFPEVGPQITSGPLQNLSRSRIARSRRSVRILQTRAAGSGIKDARLPWRRG